LIWMKENGDHWDDSINEIAKRKWPKIFS
jgi:hypothetical protein